MEDGVRSAVCHYLAHGRPYRSFRGYSWCRFRCGVERNGAAEFTDGQWAWPEGLAHYVEKHSVILPDEFVNISLRHYPPHDGRGDASQPVTAATTDREAELLGYWIAWAREHRNNAIRELLNESRAAADAAGPALIEAAVGKRATQILLREHEGTESCLWEGCSRRSLVGRCICAWHAAETPDPSELYALPKLP
jgi:hypothetical protein